MTSTSTKVIALVILVIASFFFKYEVTQNQYNNVIDSIENPGIIDSINLYFIDFDNTAEVIKAAYDYNIYKYEVNDNLNILSGIKNGALVILGYFRDFVVGFVLDYIAGFSGKGIFKKLLWLVLGLIYTFALNMIGAIFGTISLAFSLLTQHFSLGYTTGYVISLLICFFAVATIDTDKL